MKNRDWVLTKLCKTIKEEKERLLKRLSEIDDILNNQ